jgi:uncharacterized metal-binding protein YceD (DUF177 family)
MPLKLNIRHLGEKTLLLKGELSPAELELNDLDDLVRAPNPLAYELSADLHSQGILVQGRLGITLRCECVRCLKAFDYRLELPAWSALLPLEGEDKALVVNDCVDLTPYLREDIVLGFPQHPLCEAECRGLPAGRAGTVNDPNGASQAEGLSSSTAWAELNKLKL